jgi:DNA-binding Lrp family transcriptional regulator
MPFSAPARRLGWEENKFLEVLRRYKKNGVVRRLGLILAHREVGFRSNVLVAWEITDKDLPAAVKIFQKAGEVSHCYQRKAYSSWPYNVYTMVHGRNRKDCLKIVKKLSRITGIKVHKDLFTLKELKKTKADIWLLTK